MTGVPQRVAESKQVVERLQVLLLVLKELTDYVEGIFRSLECRLPGRIAEPVKLLL